MPARPLPLGVSSDIDALTAPSKKLVWFEQSGHEPFVDEPPVTARRLMVGGGLRARRLTPVTGTGWAFYLDLRFRYEISR